jgi:type II secretory pathway pseudopilin PulG
MSKRRQYKGFSLTEVLLAVGTLAIGMIFISGTFLTGIHFSTIATERTIAAVVADEAFAKIGLYGINFDPNLWTRDITNQIDPNQSVEFNAVSTIDPIEFEYPSNGDSAGQYYWSALCRLINERKEPDDPNRLVQVTVFVSRKIGANTQYRNPSDPLNLTKTYPYPRLFKVGVSGALGSSVLTLQDFSYQTFINDGYTIVEDETGQIFRVLNRDAGQPNTIQLDRPLPGYPIGDLWSGWIWVIPPPVDGGKNPCIAVYQRLIRF